MIDEIALIPRVTRSVTQPALPGRQRTDRAGQLDPDTQTTAGTCTHARRGQRQTASPPSTTNPTKARWRVTTRSASSEYITFVPLGRLSCHATLRASDTYLDTRFRPILIKPTEGRSRRWQGVFESLR